MIETIISCRWWVYKKYLNNILYQKRGGENIKANAEIRDAMQKAHIAQWQLAVKLGVCENTVQRWLRVELPLDEKEKILNAINEGVNK